MISFGCTDSLYSQIDRIGSLQRALRNYAHVVDEVNWHGCLDAPEELSAGSTLGIPVDANSTSRPLASPRLVWRA